MLSAANLSTIKSEGQRLADAVRKDPWRPVPQYEGWTLNDLVAHTGISHARARIVCESLPSAEVSVSGPPAGVEPVDWYERGLDELLAALHDADPATPVWGYLPDSTLGLWERRMVIETGLHRWDAENSLELDKPLADRVARAGLDEFGALYLPRIDNVRSLRVTAIDLKESWVYRGEKPEVTVYGSTSELYLSLQQRPSTVQLPDDWLAALDRLPTTMGPSP